MNQIIATRNLLNVPVKESVPEKICIHFAGEIIVESTRTMRVLETSHPPTYYIPKEDFLPGILAKASGQTFCEWKGITLYASSMDACFVGDEQVQAQKSGFYGGWITKNLTGPFK